MRQHRRPATIASLNGVPATIPIGKAFAADGKRQLQRNEFFLDGAHSGEGSRTGALLHLP